MSEAAHFLIKAKQQIAYAQFALENVDQSYALEPASAKIGAIISSIGEALAEIERTEVALVEEAEQKDMEETE